MLGWFGIGRIPPVQLRLPTSLQPLRRTASGTGIVIAVPGGTGSVVAASSASGDEWRAKLGPDHALFYVVVAADLIILIMHA